MKAKLIVFIIGISLFLASGSTAIANTDVQTTELTAAFLNGLNAYKKADYELAVIQFKQIAAAGVKNGKLFYNLGNAYMKNGALGDAILWYERALKLIPADPDLKFNLNYARGLVKDKKESESAPIYKVLFFWNHLLNALNIQQIAIVLNIVFGLLLTARLFIKKNVLKAPTGIILLLCVIFTATAFYNSYASQYRRNAVVLPEEVAVRSGLSEDSTSLFVLHAGTKVKIEKENQDHFRVFFAHGKIGWVNKAQLGVIE
ncbi:tetratricopeptide repeat protein [Desulfococcaceae bacterium HSG9]|nr:tetratricopeptide repeat protein [Desulfococcaceae bacterium HSG9]